MLLPDRARPSRSESVALNLTKTLIQTATLWGLALWLAPLVLASLERSLYDWQLPAVSTWPVWTAFALLGGTGIYCGVLFVVHGRGTPLPLDSTTRFLVLGPYRWIRNPMAVFGIGQGLCVGLALRSPMVVVYSLTGGVLWHLVARPWEERDLEARFGEEYRAYRARVRNWVPRLKPYPKVLAMAKVEVGFRLPVEENELDDSMK
jgi:protein-S-isoprenylcysteine O-methyltransferase Ste14